MSLSAEGDPVVYLHRPKAIEKQVLEPIFTVENEALSESSGLSMSRKYPGWFWSHNDSGDLPRLFLLKPDASRVGAYVLDQKTAFVAGQANLDWEDICLADDGFLYVGSFGNNEKKRTKVSVLKIAEPDFKMQNMLVDAERFDFTYDRPFVRQNQQSTPVNKDCEALCQWQDGLLLFTKRLIADESDVYLLQGLVGQTDNKSTGLAAKFITRLQGLRGVTAAASWNRGEKIAILTYWSIWVFACPDGDLQHAWRDPVYLRIDAGQCEAISFIDAHTLWVTNEAQEVFEVSLEALVPATSD